MRRYKNEQKSVDALPRIETVKTVINNFKEQIESLKKIESQSSQVIHPNKTELNDNSIA